MTRVYLQDTELTGGTGSNISAEDLRKYFEPYRDDDNEYPYLLYGNVNGDTFQYIFYAGQKAEFDPSLPPGALFEYLPDDKTDPNFGKCFLNMGHELVDVTGLLSVSWNDIIDKPDFDSYQTADQVSQTIQDALSDLDISGFLKRIDLTESEYAALETKDHDTVYVVEEDEPEPPKESKAYAVLDDEGTLTFIRSYDDLDIGDDQTIVDIAGHSYTGFIFPHAETSNSWLWYSKEIQKVLTISDQIISRKSMASMFNGCSSLTSIDLSSFDTSNVTDMNGMFMECSSLTSIDLSSFDTSNVTDMAYMFDECSSLTSIDLSSFDTSNVTDMVCMFDGCRKLKIVYAKNWYNSARTVVDTNMFSGSILLPGYNHVQTGWSKARIYPDGYFTDPATKPTS